MIVDSTCEVDQNGTQALQGVGVTAVNLNPASSNMTNMTITDTFRFLSNAQLQCNCYDLRDPFSNPSPSPLFTCRHTVVRCPYMAQEINGTISIRI